MPYSLSDYEGYPKRLPVSYINVPVADVPIGVIGTYAIGATLGTLPAGTYKIAASVSILNGAVAAAFFNSRLSIGGVFYAPTESSCIISGAVQLYVPEFTVHIPVAAIVRIEATGTQLGTIKYIQINGGANPGATWISATRIK